MNAAGRAIVLVIAALLAVLTIGSQVAVKMGWVSSTTIDAPQPAILPRSQSAASNGSRVLLVLRNDPEHLPWVNDPMLTEFLRSKKCALVKAAAVEDEEIHFIDGSRAVGRLAPLSAPEALAWLRQFMIEETQTP